MTIKKILEIQEMGDTKGSALRELALYYGCEDFDLSPISDQMAEAWQNHKEIKSWEPGNWI